mgnify:FL=1
MMVLVTFGDFLRLKMKTYLFTEEKISMKQFLIIAILLSTPFQTIAQNTQITSFSASKKLLLRLYKDNPVTLFCGCSYKLILI